MKTIEVRREIEALIKSACPNVYYGQANDKASFPYAIYTVEEVTKIDLTPACELEINVVGYGRDTSAIENICDRIESDMDHLTIIGDKVSFTLYFERKNNVFADDRNIIRRRMVFTFNLYET